MDAKSWIQEIRAAGKLMAAGDLAGAENRYPIAGQGDGQSSA